ncbi:restriction endonuclease subunit S [Corynebacterium pseudodiphtheriticum]|uniref:restriction endonuclease subunit S n=1 Tax=Corynebacterium pseudodiphtheriticum TaxID=37637 RepID=UPI00254085B9|nr:restriction endonuclease subunit S [Corynebacterium pseudodiphtheriticum]MDK4285179.1 restriction endonuclease subunit S [Corynebacterium pseudodiphtheriticum]MDK4315055.1 restriction endonuclease subunit S [Corynebacterium pseudodiphtheriticum]
MSRVDDLIKELCPNGVEYKQFGELGKFSRGGGIQKKHFTDTGVPAVHYGQIYTHYGIWAEEANRFVAAHDAEKAKRASHGDVLIADASENDEDLGSAVAWLGDHDVVLSNHLIVFTPESGLDSKYVSYFLRSSGFQDQKRKIASGTKVRSLSVRAVSSVEIPVPPLEIQQEIARILDKFTQLEAELEAELEARRKQYAYYREQLLTAGDSDTKSVMLKDISDMKAGKSIPAAEISDKYSEGTPVPCFGGGGMRGYVAESNQTGGKVLIGRQGALCGNVAWASDDFYATEHAVVVSAQSELDPRWAFHKFIAMNLNQYASKSAQPGLAVQKLKKLQIDLPPLARQREVAAILDKFDALVNDISTGLPAEIAARRKQYEYYRNKLLSFEPV